MVSRLLSDLIRKGLWFESTVFLKTDFLLSKKLDRVTNDQLRRPSFSIKLNISEGSILQSTAEFKRFLGYSIRSLAEVVTCLHKAKRRKYIKETEFEKYYDESFHLMNMMISFRNTLK